MSLSEPFAGRAPLGGFVVQEPCITRRSAPLRHGTHGDEPIVRPQSHSKLVTRLNQLGGLGAAAVEVNLATRDGGCRESPRLEKPGGPEPFVEPNPLASAEIIHRQ